MLQARWIFVWCYVDNSIWFFLWVQGSLCEGQFTKLFPELSTIVLSTLCCCACVIIMLFFSRLDRVWMSWIVGLRAWTWIFPSDYCPWGGRSTRCVSQCHGFLAVSVQLKLPTRNPWQWTWYVDSHSATHNEHARFPAAIPKSSVGKGQLVNIVIVLIQTEILSSIQLCL